MSRLDGGHTVALDDPIAAARFAAEEVEAWRDAGIYYFVPCVFEGRAIATLALGRKETEESFNSEDLTLLTAPKMIADQRLGRKNGRGFYDWSTNPPS
jgi:GAF domain-containing protein